MALTKIPFEIETFYEELEKVDSLDYWNLSEFFTGLELLHDYKWRKILAAEQLCFRFYLSEGKLTSHFETIDGEGKPIESPSVTSFDSDQIEYLKKRAKESANVLLLARYNHVLCEREKNQKFAISAIKFYKKILTNVLFSGKESEVADIFPAIVNLAKRIKRDINEIRDYAFDLFEDEKISLWIKDLIVHEMMRTKFVKLHELKFLPDRCLVWIGREAKPNYGVVKEMLMKAVKISLHNELDTSELYNKLAENEDLILSQHIEDEDFLKSMTLGRQMDYYKKANNLEMYEEKQIEYTKAKSKVELKLIEAPLSKELQDILNQDIRNKVEEILKWETNTIFNYFSNHSPLFPDIDNIIKDAIERYDKSFLKYFSTCQFDQNVNVTEPSLEKQYERKIFEEYQIAFAIGALAQFLQVVHFGTINMKVSYAKLYKYLDDFSWFGQSIPKAKMRSSKERKSYKWLNFIAPAVHNLFFQLEQSFLVGAQSPHVNYMLSIDSLTLKFEGALRDFVRILGGSTSVIKRNVIQEMLLEDLLESQVVQREFTANDIALFKMTFTNRGENVRNNVAHCFYLAEDYTLEKACRILFCFLRLGKYKLKPKDIPLP